MNSYEILTGVGRLYVAPVGTAFPALTASPSGSWRDLGETQEGVTVTYDEEIEEITVDQETGPVKAHRTSETLAVETNLAMATLENLADVLGVTVTDTPPGSGTIGTREVPNYKGSAVKEFAFLFRGDSPYGDYPAQYEIRRGYFGGSVDLEHVKDGNAKVKAMFHALVNLSAANDSEKFGRLIAQDAAAL